MATNNMRPIHPGEVLREEYLLPLGLSANALAMDLHVPAPRINDIVRERRAVTPDTALRLARYFDTTPQFWMNLQTAFDLKQAEAAIGEKVTREIRPMHAVAAWVPIASISHSTGTNPDAATASRSDSTVASTTRRTVSWANSQVRA